MAAHSNQNMLEKTECSATEEGEKSKSCKALVRPRSHTHSRTRCEGPIGVVICGVPLRCELLPMIRGVTEVENNNTASGSIFLNHLCYLMIMMVMGVYI